jgi:hypothetical protein
MTTVEQHFNCLDTLRIRAAGNRQPQCECGILLEIWASGGLLQSDRAFEKSEKILIHLDGTEVEAEVQSCEEDIFGYYIRFSVDDPWFPESYQPILLKSGKCTPEVDEDTRRPD